MSDKQPRRYRGYDGTGRTTRKFGDVLPSFVSAIDRSQHERHDLILAAWPQLVGPSMAPLTRAVAFQDGVLSVRVNNSSLLALLSRTEKPKLLSLLRKKFPQVRIREIRFRIG